MIRAAGFAPVSGPGARVLVLGSLPGVRSLRDGEYFAHPRNTFWDIVEELLDIPRALPYAERTARLIEARVALWDVLHSSVRPGSLDTSIDVQTAEPNDFAAFFALQPGLRLVAFNGRKAAELFARLVRPGLGAELPRCETLPSTSPAHAAMPYHEKLRQWSLVSAVLRD